MSDQELLWMLVPAAGTLVGGLAILAVGRPSDRTLDLLLGFTAGVMLAATSFSLLEPALERGGFWEVAVGFVLGRGCCTGRSSDTAAAHHQPASQRGTPARLPVPA